MGIFEKAIDWLAEQVQTTTGEKERKENVSRLKQLALEFKERVSEAIVKLNEAIKSFNESIHNLNAVRNTGVKANIEKLYLFLEKFGSCKPAGFYAEEEEKLPAEFPQQDLDSIENYIGGIDWTKDEVFLNTFLLSPLGMKMKTRKQNLSMLEQIHELQLQTEATVKELSVREFATIQEKEICELYIANVEFITNFISEHIFPELELVEAFFQAQKIKNEILCAHTLVNLKFAYDIRSIKNTAYHKHYQFIKNTLAFYVISCRIYNTPVLTNLLRNQTTQEDVDQLKLEHSVLLHQSKEVSNAMAVSRGGES
jgi:hypothetical protein